MPPRSRPRLALVFALSAGLATAIACGPSDDGDKAAAEPAPPAAAPPPKAPAGPFTRRILPNCDPVKAALAAIPAIGSNTRLALLWDGAKPRYRPRNIPVRVLEVRQTDDPPVVVIEMAPVRDRELILELGEQSGHFRVDGPDILLDPCSANLFLN